MKRLLALVPAVLFSTAALAQEVPEAAKMDLWCGIAFGVIAADVPADASDEDKALAKQFADGSVMLIDRATAAHMEAGYDETSFATYKTEQEAHVQANMGGPQEEVDYKYEDCAPLIGL